jgi:hypothetical protein
MTQTKAPLPTSQLVRWIERVADRLRQSFSGGSGVGGSGRGVRPGDAGHFMNEALSRLEDAGITANPDFVGTLESFLIVGLGRAEGEGEGASLERFESAWSDAIGRMIRFAAENKIQTFDAAAFERIRTLLCPGFWPFC